MKKLVMSLAVVVMMFVLTGCGTEKLTCTQTSKETGMTMDQKIDATFVNNEVTDLNIKLDVKLDDSYASYIDTMKDMLEKEYKTYSDNGGKVDVTTEDKIIHINILMDAKKMTDKQKKALDMTDVYGTKKATAKELEKQGFTCK